MNSLGTSPMDWFYKEKKVWSGMIVASELSLVISDILCQVLTGSTLLFFFVEPIHG